MPWYFVEQGAKNGPHEERAFEELIQSGRVGPKTLVWRPGMATWQPLEEVAPPLSLTAAQADTAAARVEEAAVAEDTAAAEQVTAAAAEAGAAAVSSVAAASERCGVCGAERSADDLMRFRDTLVCPECKPAFVQRMREGSAQPGQLRYGGFWIRFAAKFVDGIILTIFSFLITALAGAAGAGLIAGGGTQPPIGTLMAIQGVTMLVQLAVQAGFVTFFLSRFAATPGKMVTGLVVVRSDGSTLTTGRAFGRFFGEWLSGLTLGIGYLMAAFDQEKRALHDRVCDTRVVYKSSTPL